MMSSFLNGLNFPAKVCPGNPELHNIAFAFKYPIQFDTANFIVRMLLTFTTTGSSQFMLRVIGMKAVNQSTGWLVLSWPYLSKKSVLGPPTTLGLIGIVSLSYLVGDFFLLISFLLLHIIANSRRGFRYLIFLFIPVKAAR